MARKLKPYKNVLNKLKERLALKHEQYGISYQDKSLNWMRERMEGEIKELDKILYSVFASNIWKINEALDIAICALLIADMITRLDQ